MFELVEKRSRELNGLSPAMHGRFAGFWRRPIAVGLQRDIARNVFQIKDGSLQKGLLRHGGLHTAVDVGRS